MKITLPIRPISTNSIWYGRKGITNKYRKYQEEFMMLLPRGIKTTDKPCEVNIKVFLKSRYEVSDTDNFIKGTLDCLCKGGIISNDRIIKRIIIEKFKAKEDGIEIEIEQV